MLEAAYYDGYSQKTFLDEVRRGLKMVKNRHNKNVFRNRQLQRQELEQTEYEEEELAQFEEIEEQDDILPEFIKEEILCD